MNGPVGKLTIAIIGAVIGMCMARLIIDSTPDLAARARCERETPHVLIATASGGVCVVGDLVEASKR